MQAVMKASYWACVVVLAIIASTFVSHHNSIVSAAPSKTSSPLARRLAPVLKHRLQGRHVLPALMEELVADFEDPDMMDFYDAEKRQFDDYGHMRFGKRGGDYDDYGHLRFGRNLAAHDRQMPKRNSYQ